MPINFPINRPSFLQRLSYVMEEPGVAAVEYREVHE